MSEQPLAKPWSVARLADYWEVSRVTIYAMIKDGRLKAFPVGKRGLRIHDEERRRCEGEGLTSTPTGTLSSLDAEKRPSPASQIKMVSAGARG